MKVFIYFNLHKKVWSVKALEGENKGRVINHVSNIILKDAKFKVSEAGRQRVLKEKKKNVHAGVVGTISDEIPVALYERVTYNPYKYSTFIKMSNQESILSSKCVVFDGKVVHAHPEVAF
jgi:hypothetical protein